MVRQRIFVFRVGLCAGTVGVVTLLASCLADPREGEEVAPPATCDVAQLSADPTNPQSTLRTYLEAADQLLTRATAVEAELRDACNAINQELQLPPGGSAVTACRPIAAQAEEVNKAAPAPPPGAPFWIELRYAPECTPKPTVLPECLSKCGPACDATKCDQGRSAGNCAGECQGVCETRGDQLPCNGACVGEVPISGAPTTCTGQCNGVCTGVDWYGNCAASCAGLFLGRCDGTCTGSCNGQPINNEATDAGPDAEPPLPGQLVPPPNNAPANCQGFCAGVCAGGMSGFCHNSPCIAFDGGAPQFPSPEAFAQFTGGNCFGGLCAGSCKAGFGTGATETCNGTCMQKSATCDGICRGGCAGTLSNAFCEGRLDCGQNVECENACQALTALATTCDAPKVLEVYAVSNAAMQGAFEKHGAALAKAVSQIELLRRAFSFVGRRAYGDFIALGLRGELARACTDQGNKAILDADEKIRAAVSADPTIRKL